ncbi:carboxyl ester lipase, tandem duplicate 2 [Conger conger]|uniref:carboxyl ester lipase, tandem duplicate 2 n=1 Tax=Conger conger TaxID=82655 RepID=UPI002A59D841|nr:carboxyl ester lipase, tandem duplicate 2 [Conger conger]
MTVLEIAVAVALFLGSASAASLGPVITEGGMVEGKNHRLGLTRSMDVFKGIPFAAQPQRFEKPQPHPGWEGVLKATTFAKRCLQVRVTQTDIRGSEDCLYLNIWVPQGLKVSTGLPVMVYLFGGGFLVGGSMGANFLDNYLYSGEEIADRGNVIVVTLGYRVGTLGFLSSGDASGPGNYGLWDQHAGIAWVHRNIRAFGGDPDTITVFGESAGAASVNFQLISPKNKGLIRRGISQSGVSLSPWAINKNPRALAEKVAIKVGCPIDEKMMPCLKITDPVALTMAGTLDLNGSPSNPIVLNLVLAPVVDGDFLPDDPGNLFHNAADIDYIAGINNMDGHIFCGIDVPSINQPLQPTAPEVVMDLLTALTKEKGPEAANLAYQEYTKSWGSNPSKSIIKQTVAEIQTDFIFLVPTQAALYLHANTSRTARTYSYQFSVPSRIPVFPSWMGADHADDLQYVFGKPFTTPLAYFPRHRDVSGYMIAYWTNFAKTGDPNQGESKVPVTWPPFTGTEHQYLEINEDMNRNSVRQKLRTRFVRFWSETYGRLPTVQSASAE